MMNEKEEKAFWKKMEKIWAMSEEEQEEYWEKVDEERRERQEAKYGSILAPVEDIPEGCKACGGPWPDCEDSCSLFDD